MTEHNCAVHGQNMSDACICRGARYWMDRALRGEQSDFGDAMAKARSATEHEFNRANALEKQVLERDQRIADLERALVAYASEKLVREVKADEAERLASDEP